MPGRGADVFGWAEQQKKLGNPHGPGVAEASCADSGTSNVKFHVVTREDGYLAAACNTGSDGTTIMSYDTVPAHSVGVEERCRKLGCRRAFALADVAAQPPTPPSKGEKTPG